jgi:ABC-2 type transport system ATP-binding protein
MGSFEVVALSKSFRHGPPVLRGLTFRYEGAGAIGYLGPNGAGKTTTLKLLVGLLRPTAGTVRLNGFDPIAARKRALWDVGALIEVPEPYPTLTVFDTLDMVGRARGLAPRDVDTEMDRCHGLLDLPPLGQRVGWLSKGQRQRVALASALMGDPSVLLLDEPTSGLDPAERVLVRTLLHRLKRDHLVLMSSHQMLEVSEVCDRVIVLHRGRVLVRDELARVEARIRSRQVDVEFERPVAAAGVESLRPTALAVHPLTDRRWRLEFDGTDASQALLLQKCLALGTVVEFARASLPIEEAYLDLVGGATVAA